jgi:hypothetical protein
LIDPLSIVFASLARDRSSGNSIVNNVMVMSWNGNNDGLEFGMNASAPNVFVRAPDDSLKIWRSYITVNNTTLWQNCNGVVVDLGWTPIRQRWRSNQRPLRSSRRTGEPTDPNWDANTLLGQLNGQNNAVIDSMMTPLISRREWKQAAIRVAQCSRPSGSPSGANTVLR